MPVFGLQSGGMRSLARLALFALLAAVALANAPADESEDCDCDAAATLPPVEESPIPLGGRIGMVVFLVMWSGLFSGLTLGLMGLDVIGLQMMIDCYKPTGKKEEDDKRLESDPEIKRAKQLSDCAKKIMPVRQRGNMLLCTLLLGNVAVNSGLAILSDGIFSGIAGFFISTGLIVVFGEIIPQATCAQYALQIGSKTVNIVLVLMVLFCPLTFPMSKCLDIMLGKDIGQIYTTDELKEMVKLQVEKGADDEEVGAMAKQVVVGALNFREKRAKQVMTKADDLYMLSEETPLGYAQVRDIFENGHSRVPVFGKDRNDIKGLLFVKDLMLADPEDEMRLGDFIAIFNREMLTFKPDDRLVTMLSKFTGGTTHIALIWAMIESTAGPPVTKLVGAVTLEDIMEEILAEEIVDETDKYADNLHYGGDAVQRTLSQGAPPDLGRLNPVWLPQGSNSLNSDEIEAAAGHLQRLVFTSSSEFELKELRTIKWLVSSCQVMNRQRVTPMGFHNYDEEDAIYQKGVNANFCVLVLQGNIAMHVGQEMHRSEAGAFHVLGKSALRPGGFEPDFDAHMDSKRVRYLVITQDKFKEAQSKDSDSNALDMAEQELRLGIAAAASRMEAKQGVVQKPAKAGKKDKKSKTTENGKS